MRQGDGRVRKTRKRYDEPGHGRFVTFSCFQQRPFLAGRQSPLWFLDALETARKRHGFELWAYVLMPEHVHMMLLPAPGSEMSAILRSIKQPVAQRAVNWLRNNSPAFLTHMEDAWPNGHISYRFWQPGGGHDRNLREADSVHETIRYIHNNPVRRGLVEGPGDWPWSSWLAWEKGADEPISIDRESLPARER